MSIIQKLFMAIFPASWAESMEADSRAWMIRCRCGFERSVWDIGGIRWRAVGNSWTLRRCPNCHRVSWHRLYRKDTQRILPDGTIVKRTEPVPGGEDA